MPSSKSVWDNVEEYKTQAKVFVHDEDALESYLQESALVMLQLDRDQAITEPQSPKELTAALKTRSNFLEKATDLLQLIMESRRLRIKDMELAAEKEMRDLEIMIQQEGSVEG